MKRAIGIFLLAQALLTYLTIKMMYTPFIVKTLNRDTEVMTVSYSYPLMYWLICIASGIMLIVGMYLVFAKERKQTFN
ncbi:hypothetical protein ABEX35_18725 [Priestia megaterium]|uniref:hypothetical protein n=1 Tax=Priestia megaterium TaxID=1404 RepID=UPI000BF2D04B|nr:hypothetical protein [Priestia megaterium]PFK03301.1 hypothetical protein COI96_03390 [Priestia megaterium]PMD10649.1 hypothetical protein CJ194_03975 [Priestia megaterium]